MSALENIFHIFRPHFVSISLNRTGNESGSFLSEIFCYLVQFSSFATSCQTCHCVLVVVDDTGKRRCLMHSCKYPYSPFYRKGIYLL